MAGFRIGSTELVSGKVKVGSSNVSKIYQGTTLVWPPSTTSCVTIDDRCWTTVNENSTATSTSATITIATTASQLDSYHANSTPAACYWDFNSANSARGLYYNVFAAAILSPPSGYRLPTYGDFNALIDDVEVTVNSHECTALGEDPGGWSTAVQNNSRLGTSGFNAKPYGHIYANFNPVFRNAGTDVGWWFTQAVDPSNTTHYEESYSIGEEFQSGVSLGILESYRQGNDHKYALIRWVKDV